MFNVTVRITGLTEAQERFIRISESFRDFKEALETLATQLLTFYSDTVFTSEGEALLGSQWTSLKDTTVREKTRLWPGRGILDRSGTLRRGFKSTVTPATLFITNDVEYFKWQQLGTTGRVVPVPPEHPGRGRNLPPRPMLGVNALVETMARETIAEDVKLKLETAGL